MKDIPLTVSAEDRVGPDPEEDDDDLPKAFRRAKDEAEGEAMRVVVTGFDIPFPHLARFAIKATLAGLLALAVLWLVVFSLMGLAYFGMWILRAFGVFG